MRTPGKKEMPRNRPYPDFGGKLFGVGMYFRFVADIKKILLILEAHLNSKQLISLSQQSLALQPSPPCSSTSRGEGSFKASAERLNRNLPKT